MVIASGILAVVLVACGDDPEDWFIGAGGSCEKTANCRLGYVCRNLVCQLEGADCPGDKDCTERLCGPDPVCGESCGPSFAKGDVWLDPASGLTWQVTPTGGKMDLSDAKSHCAHLSLAGGGWHLPTIGELRTLIRGCPYTVTGGSCKVTDSCLGGYLCGNRPDCEGCTYDGGPSEDGLYWPDEVEGNCSRFDRFLYRSSSPIEDGNYYSWYVNFANGGLRGGPLLDSFLAHVRCVR